MDDGDRTCPWCGEMLPPVADGRCPGCRLDIDDFDPEDVDDLQQSIGELEQTEGASLRMVILVAFVIFQVAVCALGLVAWIATR